MATREAWLLAATQQLSTIIRDEAQLSVPPIAVSVGFPKGGGSGRHRAIGQCWPPDLAVDGKANIFISPELEDAVLVLATLLHELVHAAVGNKEGHKGAFIRVARAVGLVKPWTATTPSAELTTNLDRIAERLGKYPHGALTPRLKLKKGSRLRLWVCICAPTIKLRAAKDDLNVLCGTCGTQFVRQGV